MPLDSLERQSLRDGPLHRLDPTLKLVAVGAFVVGVVVTPIGAWGLLVAEALTLAVVVGISGIPVRLLLERWLGFLALFGFLAVMVAASHPSRGELGLPAVAGSVLARNSLAFLAVIVLAHVTPFPRLVAAMRRLGMPAVLASTLHFLYRYLHVLTDELERMTRARRSRSFRRRGRLDWGLLGGLVGVLFLRAFERGERVHGAMLARGWDGTLRTLDAETDGSIDRRPRIEPR